MNLYPGLVDCNHFVAREAGPTAMHRVKLSSAAKGRKGCDKDQEIARRSPPTRALCKQRVVSCRKTAASAIPTYARARTQAHTQTHTHKRTHKYTDLNVTILIDLHEETLAGVKVKTADRKRFVKGEREQLGGIVHVGNQPDCRVAPMGRGDQQ